MRFGMCAGFDQLTAVAEAGYDYAEMGAGALLPDLDETAFAPVRAQFRTAPVPVEAFNCFVPGHLKLTGPTVDLLAVKRHMDTVLRRAAEIGASIVVFGSGGARRAPDAFPLDQAREQYIEAAELAGDIAARYGITVALEPLTSKQCNFFNRVDQGTEIVDRVNCPHLRLLADLFHMMESEEPLSNLLIGGARLRHIHTPAPAIPETTAGGYPYDFPAFFAFLRQAGYDGRVTVEDNSGRLAGKEPPFTRIYTAIREHLLACLPAEPAPR